MDKFFFRHKKEALPFKSLVWMLSCYHQFHYYKPYWSTTHTRECDYKVYLTNLIGRSIFNIKIPAFKWMLVESHLKKVHFFTSSVSLFSRTAETGGGGEIKKKAKSEESCREKWYLREHSRSEKEGVSKQSTLFNSNSEETRALCEPFFYYFIILHPFQRNSSGGTYIEK